MAEIFVAGDLIDRIVCFKKPLRCQKSTGYLKHVFRSSAERYKIEEALLCTEKNYFGLVIIETKVTVAPCFKSLEDISIKTKGRVRKKGFKFVECAIKRILCNGSKYSIKAQVIGVNNEVKNINCNLLKNKEIKKIEKINWSF